MAWSIEPSESADRDLSKLHPPGRERILIFLHDRVAKLDGPYALGEALRGSRLGEFWTYRVGACRLIAKIEERRVVVLILRIGHRKEVYR